MAKRRRKSGIPGLTVNFSAKRAFGVTRAKQRFARSTGLPTTRAGRQRKIGAMVSSPRLIGIGLIILVALIILL